MENLYFLAITPPEELSRKIIEIQEDISVRFGSRAALKVIPHITLKAPFKVSSTLHEVLTDWFENMNVSISGFTQQLKDFDAFHNKNKPVIFIKPEPADSLMILQKQIITGFQDKFPDIPVMDLEFNFHPHLTVAYRDLKVSLFAPAWQEFYQKKFFGAFNVQDFHLLQHNGKQWTIIRSFILK